MAVNVAKPKLNPARINFAFPIVPRMNQSHLMYFLCQILATQTDTLTAVCKGFSLCNIPKTALRTAPRIVIRHGVKFNQSMAR
jgi:hypothetical protein